MKSKVSELLGKITRTSVHFSKPQVSKLEIDLMKHLLRDLYEAIEEMETTEKRVIEQHTPPNDVNKADPCQEAPQNFVENTTDVVTTTFTLSDAPTQPVVETVQPDFVEAKVEVTTEHKVKTSINEIVQPAETLNARLKKNTIREVHQRLSVKPLRELLDLNLRHVLVSELFSNKSDVFAQAIEQVDNAPDFDTAYSFVYTQMQVEYKWQNKPETAELFLNLMKRKFGVH